MLINIRRVIKIGKEVVKTQIWASGNLSIGEILRLANVNLDSRKYYLSVDGLEVYKHTVIADTGYPVYLVITPKIKVVNGEIIQVG